MKLHWIAVLALLGTNYGAQSEENTVQLSIAPADQVSNAGYFTLRYNDLTAIKKPFLQVSRTATFEQISHSYPIAGTEQISLSGYKNGQYYFRVFDPNSNVASDSARVTVEHHSLRFATLLFSVGLALFLFLVGLIFYFSRRNQKAE